TIIGHPWAPIGMGEQLRSHVLAANAVGLHHQVYDVFRYAQRTDPVHERLLAPLERGEVPGGIRIFHINGDEVERVVAAFEARGNSFAAGHNIIVPAWELPAYPREWVPQLNRFEEVWAISRFVQDGLRKSGVASHLVGQGVEMEPGPFLPRRHFGIRESAFVLLSFLDLSSYATRKNPQAVLAAFNALRAALPFRDLQLVLKAKNGEKGAEEWAAEIAADAQIKVISAPLDSLGVRSLINACDCFVSLHRAEGFGRGPGEAMALGRLAMATAWSGNMDFMTPDNALLVRHGMVKLARADYPYWKGQSWADPDLDHAVTLLREALENPARSAAMALQGQADVLRTHGSRAVGLRMLDRLEAIAAESLKLAPAAPVKARRRA
ncbi:MAG TPA: glycosyltransferase, partial [Acetobacteraceae bacterium]